jgi:hypothetical protein
VAQLRLFTSPVAALTLGVLLAFPSGCAHYYWPASQLESPEVTGNAWGEGRIGHLEPLSIQSGTDLIEPAEIQRPDTFTGETADPILSSSLINYAFGTTLAITPEIDVGVRISPFAPVLARGKYQLYGDPESKAQPGNLSLSAAAAVGFLLATFDGESVAFYTGNASLIGGYRFFKSHTVSFSPVLSLAGISGVGTASGTGLRYGAGVGYQYDAEALVWRVELIGLSGSFSQSTGPTQAGGFFPGMLLGLKL